MERQISKRNLRLKEKNNLWKVINKLISKGKNHFGDRLFYSIRKKGNYLCLGIDPHLNLIPKVFQNKIKITSTPYSQNNVKIVEYFCKNIIDTLADLIPVIKLQIAFFEQLGPEGMRLLSKLCHIIKKKRDYLYNWL